MTVRNEVQALLFASGRYMTVESLAELTDRSEHQVESALKELDEKLQESDDALTLVEADGQWKLTVEDDYQDLVRKIVADTELAMPVLETLAVIAWKRPILQSEVVDIRGDSAYNHIKTLRDLGFVSREPEGRTYKLKLAEKFFEYFDVEGEQEIRELFDGVERPEPELDEEEKEKIKEDKEPSEVETIQGEDPEKKLEREKEHLDEIDEELDEISKRTDETVSELEEHKDEEE